MKKNMADLCIGLWHNSYLLNSIWKNTFRLVLPLLLILTGSTILCAVPKETLDSLADENRVLSEPIELHLTSANNPLTNSTVSLNHEDAWLFFDNIRPSIVIDSFSSDILINGVQLNNGVNGRVAIYSNGTVIMPHSSSFKPLTVYTEDNFGGTSQQMAIHTYYNDLGGLDNAIKSFKLKRGYMATFANNSDGTGYSRVFIADNEDIEFDIMPEELYGTVSFIRVFKHQWVSKKGWVAWSGNEDQWAAATADIELTNSTWNYSWNDYPRTTANSEAVPQRSKLTYPGWSGINGKENVSHMLSFNEPSHPEQHQDDNGGNALTVAQALAQMPDHLKSGLRIGSPSTTNNSWLFEYIDRCDELNYRVDFVAVHCYWGGKSPLNWYNDLKYVHERTGRPVWITEWNNGANWTNEWWPDNTPDLTTANAQKQLDDITAILNVLDTASFVERYSIYNWVEDKRAMILGDTLTPAGEYYAANKSQIAYNSENEVIPRWNYSPPELSYRYLKLSNTIRLDWNNPNDELCTGYNIEKRIDDGDFDTIYSGDDISTTYYIDPVDSEINGTITYKISLLSRNDECLSSNEVSYFQFAESDSIRIGKFMISNTDWSTTLFSENYTDAPLVILGVPTFNNAIPMTQRVNGITTTSFKFHLDPWNYLNNPDLTKTDTFSTLVLPSGIYDFDGLKAEAQVVSSVNRDWITISFDEEFSTAPVVFCTIISNSNDLPLTVAVQNVTASGFEVCLKSEEAEINTSVLSEKINYLAIETGQGTIGKKRITVGKTSDGNGISYKPVEIEYDSTYSEPILFAGLLTAADNNCASTLRYSALGNHTFEVIKHRERSGASTGSKEDQMGWIIIDTAAYQKPSSLSPNVLSNPVTFYPNPVTDMLYINFDVPTNVIIMDITGHKLIEKKVINAIDISNLPSGIYVLKAVDYLPAKFIKK